MKVGNRDVCVRSNGCSVKCTVVAHAINDA